MEDKRFEEIGKLHCFDFNKIIKVTKDESNVYIGLEGDNRVALDCENKIEFLSKFKKYLNSLKREKVKKK